MSVKFSARNSGAGNGCANFMGAWKDAFFLQEKAMSIKFLVLGGGGILSFGGGVRSFEEGLADRRGLERGNPSKARDSGLFSVPFFLCPPRRKRIHFWDFFWLFLVVCLLPTPSRQPLFETSEGGVPILFYGREDFSEYSAHMW